MILFNLAYRFARDASDMSTFESHFAIGQLRQDLFNFFFSDRFHSCAFISTFRPRKRTPSASNRNRCSIAESPRSLISPPAPSTRCQGNPYPLPKIRATNRADPGNPAIRAIPPYVETFPRGIARIVRSIRSRIMPVLSWDFFLERRISRMTSSFAQYAVAEIPRVPHFWPVLPEVGILTLIE